MRCADERSNTLSPNGNHAIARLDLMALIAQTDRNGAYDDLDYTLAPEDGHLGGAMAAERMTAPA